MSHIRTVHVPQFYHEQKVQYSNIFIQNCISRLAFIYIVFQKNGPVTFCTI